MNHGAGIDVDEPMDPWVPPGEAGAAQQMQQAQQPPVDFVATMEAFQQQILEMMEAQRRQTARDMRALQTQFQTQMSNLQQQQAAAIPAPASSAPAPPQAAPAPPDPTPAAAAPTPILIQQPRKSEYDRFMEEQVKKWQIPRFEGTIDLKLVTDFLEEVRNLGEVMELQPTLSDADSDKLIVLASRSFGHAANTWFRRILLEGKYHTTFETCHRLGFPFAFDEFERMMVDQFSPTGAKENLWAELAGMQRRSYADAHAFHQAFLRVGKMLGVTRESEEQGGRAFAIYHHKLTAREKLLYDGQVETASQLGRTVTLHAVMRMVENAEASQRATNLSGAGIPAAPQAATATPAPTGTTTVAPAFGPTPMELDALNMRGRGHGGSRGGSSDRERCFKCNGAGHHAYECPTRDDYKPGGGLPQRSRGGYTGSRGGRGSGGGDRGARSSGRAGRMGSRSQVNQLEGGQGGQGQGQVIGEVREDGKVYAFGDAEDRGGEDFQ
jgi:hypothetical protein